MPASHLQGSVHVKKQIHISLYKIFFNSQKGGTQAEVDGSMSTDNQITAVYELVLYYLILWTYVSHPI